MHSHLLGLPVPVPRLSLQRCSARHVVRTRIARPARHVVIRSSATPGESRQQGPQHGRQGSDDSGNKRNPGPILGVLLGLQRTAARVLSAQAVVRLQLLARYVLVVIGAVVLGREYALLHNRKLPQEVLYSDFVALVAERRVRSARLEAANCRVYFDVVQQPPAAAPTSLPAAKPAAAAAGAAVGAAAAAAQQAAAPPSVTTVRSRPAAARPFFIKVAKKSDPLLVEQLLAAGVDYGVVRAGAWSQIGGAFITAFSLWLPLLPLFFILRKLLDARTGTGSKKSKTNYEKVTFDDVAGVEGAKAELLEVVQCLTNPQRYGRLKAKMPSGVLLCGPPGTGKTLLARAVAGEAGVPFMALSASEFVEMFVGRGAARIRDLFAEARKAAPCVVFIDELDAVGASRGRGFNEERDQTLNQLLTELDGFEGRAGVLLLAATNRPEVLDPALLRPGRISRRVQVPLPDEAGRTAIMRVHLRGTPLEDRLLIQEAASRIAAVTAGFSGAELANVVNEAALLAVRAGREEVGLRELLGGVRRTRFGVNGRTPTPNALADRFQSWLTDIAARPTVAVNAPS